MKFSDALYQKLKWSCLIGIPALGTFLGIILPALGVGEEVVHTILVVDNALIGFIGTLIGISTTAYNQDTKVGGTDV